MSSPLPYSQLTAIKLGTHTQFDVLKKVKMVRRAVALWKHFLNEVADVADQTGTVRGRIESNSDRFYMIWS